MSTWSSWTTIACVGCAALITVNISYIDDKVGDLLQALEHCGYTDNTVVIFTADHGEMLGERDLFQKKNFFEYANRVPLIFHGPGHVQSGQRTSALVSLIDLFPSIADFVDEGSTLDQIEPLQGHSLYPLLTQPGQHGDHTGDTVYGEILSENRAGAAVDDSP